MGLGQIYTSEDIYSSIKTSIINFEYPPGMQLSENEISKKFNVSRTPIKSVFTRLQNEGFLVVFPQRGTYVSMLDKQKIKDFIYMRLVLEIDIVDAFIKQLEDQDIAILKSLIEEQNNLLSKDDFVKIDFFTEDVKFHGYLFEKLGHAGIWGEIQKLQVNYTRFRMLDISNPVKFAVLIQEHIELYNAILNKDINAYKNALTKHLQQNFEQTINSVKQEYFI
ncbi:MAG: GntR family transcriptional regulator [Clostridia bacterium]